MLTGFWLHWLRQQATTKMLNPSPTPSPHPSRKQQQKTAKKKKAYRVNDLCLIPPSSLPALQALMHKTSEVREAPRVCRGGCDYFMRSFLSG